MTYSPHLDPSPDHPIEGAVTGVRLRPTEVFTRTERGRVREIMYSGRHEVLPDEYTYSVRQDRTVRVPDNTELVDVTVFRAVTLEVDHGTDAVDVLEVCRALIDGDY